MSTTLAAELDLLARPARAHRRRATAARATTRAAGCARRSPRSRRASRCTAPTSPPRGVSETDRRYIDWAVRAARAREPHRRSRACSTSCRACSRSMRRLHAGERRARNARLRHALPAVHRAGGGEGRRGHRVLPLQPPDRAERGRRRPARASACRSRRSMPRARTARGAGPTPCSAARRTTPSAPRTRARASAVLSELPSAWRLALRRWSLLNRSRRGEVDGVPRPRAATSTTSTRR